MPIKVLSKDVINKIAAGEVVERPVSVLKELLDNALDAQAENIIVEIEQGGLGLIKVSDNGIGMSKEDAQLAMQRHATSKINHVDDLLTLNTLGFRGEALASIASVSQFVLETKTKDCTIGTQLLAKGTSQFETTNIACADGTSVAVKELFFNIPVRRKFLKSPQTEYNHILDAFTGYALLHYTKGFKLIYNGKEIYNLIPQQNWAARLKALFTKEIGDNLIIIEPREWDINIKGFIGTPAMFRNNRKHQFVYINNRLVSDYLIAKAVKDAYKNLIPRDGYPVFVLNINLDPSLVDVNIHPRKTEVRFVYPQIVYRSVNKAVDETLASNNLVTSVNLGQPEQSHSSYQNNWTPPTQSTNYAASANTLSQQRRFYDLVATPANNYTSVPNQSNDSVDIDVASYDFKQYKILGQLHKAYIICEVSQGLALIDQHAAAERILYDELKANHAQAKTRSQQLLVPVQVELPLKEAGIFKSHYDHFTDLGFEVNLRDDSFLEITKVPMTLQDYDIKPLFMGIIDDLDADEITPSNLEDKQERVLKYASCRGAIKFNDKLEFAEMDNLVRTVFEQKITSCPHGRPVMLEFNLDKLAVLFKRI